MSGFLAETCKLGKKILHPIKIPFTNECELRTFQTKRGFFTIKPLLYVKISLGWRQMIPDGNLHKGVRISRNGNYVSKYVTAFSPF